MLLLLLLVLVLQGTAHFMTFGSENFLCTQTLYREGVWGSNCTAPHILDSGSG
jgi:hypothetical protein